MQRTREKVALWGDLGDTRVARTAPDETSHSASKALQYNLYTIKFTRFECIYFVFYHRILYESNVYTQKIKSMKQQRTAYVKPRRTASEKGLLVVAIRTQHPSHKEADLCCG